MSMPSMPGRRGHHILPFGRFYGSEDVRRSVPGLEMSLLRADPHRVVERHSHESAHFVLVLDGLYISTADGAPPVSAQPILIYNPAGTTHSDRFEARNHLIDGRSFTISITDVVVSEAARGGSSLHHPCVLASPDAIDLAMRLSRACTHDGADSALTQHSLALDLLRRVVRVPDVRDTGAPAWLRRARERLDDSLGVGVSMTDVAAAADVHAVHLARVFRQHMGVTPAEYLRRRRLDQARVLLRDTVRPLADIALTCGFSDQSHFTNAFKRAEGETPLSFRGRHAR